MRCTWNASGLIPSIATDEISRQSSEVRALLISIITLICIMLLVYLALLQRM